MADEPEVPLSGGAQTSGIVRVGSTVRRPAHRRSAYVQRVLRDLQEAGFDGAPRPLGFDAQGREAVSFVVGDVSTGHPFNLTDDQLVAAADLVRRFHDATAGTSDSVGPTSGDQQVVCHGDLGPHNTVFRAGRPVAIIDWDADVRPGLRAVDFADAVWGFADLTDDSVPVTEQARRTALMCAAYPGMTPAVVVAELAAQFRRARANHAAAGRGRAVAVFDGLLAWLATNGAVIAAAIE